MSLIERVDLVKGILDGAEVSHRRIGAARFRVDINFGTASGRYRAHLTVPAMTGRRAESTAKKMLYSLLIHPAGKSVAGTGLPINIGPDESVEDFTDRLAAEGLNVGMYRQCSIGWHEECSDPDGDECTCPCHIIEEKK